MEEWKDIPGYEGLYQASTLGRIKSYDRLVNTVYGAKRTFKGRVKALRPDSQDRYILVDFGISGQKETRLVHRLIALTFLGNCDGLEINHLNGNTKDNRVVNIEITTKSENQKHKYRVLKRRHPFQGRTGSKSARSKAVAMLDAATGEKLKVFESARLAEKEGFTSACISLCCNGGQELHKGFRWKFEKQP